jgi:uncharacterized membrane protein YfcA
LAAVSFAAGLQNALAGGGSFLIFPTLVLMGLDPRTANITCTIALFPAQAAAGVAGRRQATGTASLTFSALFGVSLLGGAAGAVLLLHTPTSLFTVLVPWLVLFATLVFAWGSFGHRTGDTHKHLGAAAACGMQFAISVYGGYFGGGIGFLMLAVLTMAGLAIRNAGSTKNVLAAVINSTAVVIFLCAGGVAWKQVAVVGTAALAGGQAGAYVLQRVNERVLRIGIVLLGVALTIGLFVRYHRP